MSNEIEVGTICSVGHVSATPEGIYFLSPNLMLLATSFFSDLVVYMQRQ